MVTHVLTAGRHVTPGYFRSGLFQSTYSGNILPCFNRTEEIEMLSSVLSPQLSVITGPVDCGKSLLARKVLDLVEDEMKMPVVSLNLQAGADPGFLKGGSQGNGYI